MDIIALRNSNPVELATKFCNDYSLPEAIIDPLCNRIRQNMETHYNIHYQDVPQQVTPQPDGASNKPRQAKSATQKGRLTKYMKKNQDLSVTQSFS